MITKVKGLSVGEKMEDSDNYKIKPVKSYYDQKNLENLYHNPHQVPGQYPFLRGIHPDMYKGRLWTMRQYAGFADAQTSNKRYHALLKNGQTGLSIAFDLPTQMGYDSDHPMAQSEVGLVGVAICTLEDMEMLLKDLPLDSISTSMTINATAAILLAFYIAVAKKQNISFSKLRGTIQNDILKEYIARGTYIYPPQPSLRIITDIFKYCQNQNFNTISISGYHIREAGSSAAQELAFTLANGITYVEAALKAGLTIDEFAPRLSFFFNIHNHFLEEIAKLRAARVLWADIMKNRFKAQNPKSQTLRFHAQTAGSTLTALQPYNNIVRVALQAMAAVLGGTQSLHTNAMDEALGIPTQQSATIALRTQQIIAHETNVIETSDPLGGSYYIEALTSELIKEAQSYIQRIESLGGVVSCIESGWIQNQIQAEAYKTQKAFEEKSQIHIGVNAFTTEENFKPETLKIDPLIQAEQIARIKAFKARRDPQKVHQQLEKIYNVANSKENLMPVLVEAVENSITLGEISSALEKVFHRYQEVITF